MIPQNGQLMWQPNTTKPCCRVYANSLWLWLLLLWLFIYFESLFISFTRGLRSPKVWILFPTGAHVRAHTNTHKILVCNLTVLCLICTHLKYSLLWQDRVIHYFTITFRFCCLLHSVLLLLCFQAEQRKECEMGSIRDGGRCKKDKEGRGEVRFKGEDCLARDKWWYWCEICN